MEMKLIRSKYDTIIEASRLLIEEDEKQRKMYLKKKFVEEIQEIKDSKYKDINEYGDVLEVLEALAGIHGISMDDIYRAKKEKTEKYGDFSKGIYLKK